MSDFGLRIGIEGERDFWALRESEMSMRPAYSIDAI